MVQVEVARRHRLVAALDEHADHLTGREQVVGPLHRSGAGKPLGQHPAAGDIERQPVGAQLAVALVLGIMVEASGAGAREMVAGCSSQAVPLKYSSGTSDDAQRKEAKWEYWERHPSNMRQDSGCLQRTI